jgi:uridine kinase
MEFFMSFIVIGISGVSGAGKTTLTKYLSEKLNATSLFWDDFDEVSTSPDNYVEWFYRGGLYDEFDYNKLAYTLKHLKKGHKIEHPALKNILYPNKTIIKLNLFNI